MIFASYPQNYWVLGLCPSSGIVNNYKTYCLIEVRIGLSLLSSEDANRSSFPKVYILVFRIPGSGQSPETQ
jgi:hypothetical protein